MEHAFSSEQVPAGQALVRGLVLTVCTAHGRASIMMRAINSHGELATHLMHPAFQTHIQTTQTLNRMLGISNVEGNVVNLADASSDRVAYAAAHTVVVLDRTTQQQTFLQVGTSSRRAALKCRSMTSGVLRGSWAAPEALHWLPLCVPQSHPDPS